MGGRVVLPGARGKIRLPANGVTQCLISDRFIGGVIIGAKSPAAAVPAAPTVRSEFRPARFYPTITALLRHRRTPRFVATVYFCATLMLPSAGRTVVVAFAWLRERFSGFDLCQRVLHALAAFSPVIFRVRVERDDQRAVGGEVRFPPQRRLRCGAFSVHRVHGLCYLPARARLARHHFSTPQPPTPGDRHTHAL